MAEPSTIARPYAAALFQSSSAADGAQLSAQLDALAGIADDGGLRQFAADPKVSDEQGFGLVTGIAGNDLSPKLRNLLSAVIDNGRLAVLPELCNTGYVFETREEALGLSEEVPDGPTCDDWMAAAREHSMFIVAGITST